MLDTCGRFGGSQSLHNPFFSADCGDKAATASGKRGDLGEAEPPQTPPPHKLYHILGILVQYKEIRILLIGRC
jgi:hypothetical protein